MKYWFSNGLANNESMAMRWNPPTVNMGRFREILIRFEIAND